MNLLFVFFSALSPCLIVRFSILSSIVHCYLLYSLTLSPYTYIITHMCILCLSLPVSLVLCLSLSLVFCLSFSYTLLPSAYCKLQLIAYSVWLPSKQHWQKSKRKQVVWRDCRPSSRRLRTHTARWRANYVPRMIRYAVLTVTALISGFLIMLFLFSIHSKGWPYYCSRGLSISPAAISFVGCVRYAYSSSERRSSFPSLSRPFSFSLLYPLLLSPSQVASLQRQINSTASATHTG